MNKGVKITLIAVLAVVLLLGIGGITTYNGLVSGKEAISSEEANIDVQYKRRADLIPNLVETVKGYSAHEQEIVDKILQARTALVNAGSLNEKAEADSELKGAIDNLMVNVENYPDLKADSTYLTLMDEIEGTENRIAVARRDYNTKVKEYNNKVIRFPSNIIAGMSGFEKCEYLEIDDKDKENVEVNFN